MAKKFNLGDSLAAALGNVSVSDTEQITYIEIGKVGSDKDNFYSMDGIDELAANIELIGLQQPLRVRPDPEEPETFIIVSGHRRRKAIEQLYRDNPVKWARVPCIVEQPASSPELQELRLIMANADTRRMSSADVAKQAERVEELLYKLKEQGYEFPGRMRDHVAEACKVSSTKLAELRMIQTKLIPELRQMWEKNEINHTVAYSLAKADEREQIRLTELRNEQEIRYAPEWRIDSWLQKLHGIAVIHCPDDGSACSNVTSRENRAITMHNPCGMNCCIDCWNLIQCSDACEKAKAVAEKKRAENEKREAEQKAFREKAAAERAAREKKEREAARAAWARTLGMAERAGMKPRTLTAIWAECEEDEVEEDEIDQVLGYASGETPTDCAPWVDSPEILIEIADQLHCSTDYLLGRTDDSASPAAPAQQELQFRSGTQVWISTNDALPKQGCEVLILDEDGDVDFDRIDGDGRWFYSFRTPPKWWAPIPPAPGEDPEPYYAEPVTNPEPRWQQGDPLRPGRYLCLVDMGEYDIHEQRCDWTGSEWEIYGGKLDDLFMVMAWYPLPDKDRFRQAGTETTVEADDE